MELLSGAEMVVRALHDEGVKTIFGYPGGAVLHIYDALFQQKDITHILVRHEQAAAHMADGYARASGKPGVCLATSGPGATNTVTGIATAYMDSIPMIIITGQVQSDWIGNDAFQETDIVGVTRPIVKHSFMVKKQTDIPEIIKKAFYIATTGRPGPVLIDIPKDITNPAEKFEYHYPAKVKMRSYSVVHKGHPGQIKKAVDLLVAAKRPIVYSGGGVVQGNGSELLTELVRELGIPITNTLMGLGAYPGDDKQFVGMLGMHGTYEANMAMHHADVVLAVGCRFDDRVTNNEKKFCPNASIIHIDVDPASISKNVPVDVPIVGPVDQILKEMLDQLKKTSGRPDTEAMAAWWKQIDAWRAHHGLRFEKGKDLLKPQEVIRCLYEVTKGDAIITSDVGQHQMFAAQHYPFKRPRQWINSGGLGTMGFGLPAAMGCLVARPDADVACVTGEGSIQMCIQELATCMQYGFPVKIITLNNQSLGMVRQWQDMQYQGRYSSSTYEESLPDFVKLAEAYGHVGMKVNKPEELRDAMEECFSLKDRLVFMDIAVDPTEHVYPMQIKEGSMRDMWLSKTERT
ncbi:MAG: acetolactate synthase 3 large subunit [Deltaproteobacteria bacterium]|nr:MAG: acetolactate synthase 3 large subunit [Deltaproteobacteria bacterium]